MAKERPERQKSPRPPTPLRLYLDRYPAITPGQLGDRMAEYLGGEAPSSASLAQWSAGSRAPSARAQLAMSEATGGEVAPIDWTRWRAAVEEKQSRAKRRGRK